ncbi:hypothetical protein CICLE_v10010843mg [Citrus x clementina]|uniref:Uncharacterized protein n=1 Tax=Citrus clementina TaxID=85681 RepID=V4UH86_CITCL|nr:hypothetical protein CICLE_v10010843mg [Citrus x clementina]
MNKMQLYVPKWAARIDKKGYTLLHHVADMKHYKQGIRTWSCSPISGGVTVVRGKPFDNIEFCPPSTFNLFIVFI